MINYAHIRLLTFPQFAANCLKMTKQYIHRHVCMVYKRRQSIKKTRCRVSDLFVYVYDNAWWGILSVRSIKHKLFTLQHEQQNQMHLSMKENFSLTRVLPTVVIFYNSSHDFDQTFQRFRTLILLTYYTLDGKAYVVLILQMPYLDCLELRHIIVTEGLEDVSSRKAKRA